MTWLVIAVTRIIIMPRSVKPQPRQAYDHVTTYRRPKNGPIVERTTDCTMTYHQQKDRSQYATASGDRSKHCRSVARSPNHNQSYDQAIVRSGVTVAKAPVKPGLRPCYDLPATKNGPILERTYDWPQRSYDWSQMWWVIARGKSVATSSMYVCMYIFIHQTWIYKSIQ